MADEQESLSENVDKRTGAHTFESRTVDSDIGTTESWAEFNSRVAEDLHHAKMVGVHRAQTFFDQMMSQVMSLQSQMFAAHARSVENVVDTANLVNKQAASHRDIAIDRLWNVNETDAAAVILATRVAENTKPAKEA